MLFRVEGLGVWGFGFGVWGLGFGVWGLGFRVWGSGCGVRGVGFEGWGLGFKPGVAVWRRGADGSCTRGAASEANSTAWEVRKDTVSAAECSETSRTCRAATSVQVANVVYISYKTPQANPPNACGARTRRRQGVIEP